MINLLLLVLMFLLMCIYDFGEKGKIISYKSEYCLDKLVN